MRRIPCHGRDMRRVSARIGGHDFGMNTFPTWTAFLLLVPCAVALARYHDRRVPSLEWATMLLASIGVVYAVFTQPQFLNALGMMAVLALWFGTVVAVAALIEALPGLVRGRHRHARPRPVAARSPWTRAPEPSRG